VTVEPPLGAALDRVTIQADWAAEASKAGVQEREVTLTTG